MHVPCSVIVLIQHCAARVPDKADFRFFILFLYIYVLFLYRYPLGSRSLIFKIPVPGIFFNRVRQLCVLSPYVISICFLERNRLLYRVSVPFSSMPVFDCGSRKSFSFLIIIVNCVPPIPESCCKCFLPPTSGAGGYEFHSVPRGARWV